MVRSYDVLRQRPGRHGVTLAPFVRDTDPPAALDHLRALVTDLAACPIRRSVWRNAAAIGRSALSGDPVLITRDHVPEMSRLVRRLSATTPFDAIHADQLWMAPYALEAGARGPVGPPRPRLILDQHNAVHLIPSRLAGSARNPLLRFGWRREARQMAGYETRACQTFDQVVTVTNADRQALERLGGAANGRRPPFVVIPICIDTQAVTPRPRAAVPGILFLG